jgi:serine/threonine-protein phosphatase CPPED1
MSPTVTSFQPFRFIFMADCQIGCYASFSGLDDADVARYAEMDMIVRAVPVVRDLDWDVDHMRTAVAAANRIAPDFVVVGGDMVDDPQSRDQYQALRSAVAGLDDSIPLHWVAGNHDVAFDTVIPTPASIAAYRERFGPDRYVFVHGGVTFLVANTVVWDHPEEADDAWSQEISWLERELEAAAERGSRHTIVFGHHPLFTATPDEPDTYWNIPTERRTLLLDLFSAHGVDAMLCGHWHRNGGGTAGDLDVVVTGPVGYPLGRDPSGFRVVAVGDDGIDHDYVALDEI